MSSKSLKKSAGKNIKKKKHQKSLKKNGGRKVG